MGEDHKWNIVNSIFGKKDKNQEEEIFEEIIEEHFSELIKG